MGVCVRVRLVRGSLTSTHRCIRSQPPFPTREYVFYRMYDGYIKQALKSNTSPPEVACQQSNDIALRLYSLGTPHKHVAEMQHFSRTAQAPLFVPSVDHTFCGMLVSTPIPARYLPGANAVEQIYQTWNAYYQDAPFVSVGPPTDKSELWPPGAFVDQASCNFTNRVDLCAFGNPEQGVVLVGRLDNLGKGASGNAVQCLNLMLGFDETAGLTI